MKVEGRVGAITASVGDEEPVRLHTDGALVTRGSSAKYEDAVLAGNVYVASNQAAVALTAAMATTYTGLCLFNPSTSTKNLVLLGAGYSTTVAVPTATVIGLMTGTVVTAATMTAAASITPRNRLVGSTNTSVAIVDDGCTLNGTPVLEQTFGSAWTEATTAGTVGPVTWVDMNGSLALKPGSYVAFYSFAANTAAFICSFLWKEVSI